MALDNKLSSLLAKHTQWRLNETINLIPSENVTSPAVRDILASDLGHRYTLMVNDTIHGVFIENAYGGTKFTDEIELEAEGYAKQVYGAKYCTLKPLSGHIAGLIMLLALCKRNDRIMIVDAKDGGYDGYLPEYMSGFLGLEVDPLPFVESEWNLDFESSAQAIRDKKPQLVLIGASFILFPYKLRPLRDACDDVGAYLGYDASHVLGLIAGGEFQEPLKDGVDIVTGSTHKTLFGPQGGLILTDREDVYERVNDKLAWHTLDNPHQNRIAALGQALLELKEFGADYARQVILNSKKLGHELTQHGIPVKFSNKDFTESHQLLMDIDRIKSDLGLNSRNQLSCWRPRISSLTRLADWGQVR